MDKSHIEPPNDPEQEFEVFDLNRNDLKVEINNLLWKWLPGNTTLDFADRFAARWFDAICALHENRDKP